ncbi:MAG: hypothetical protein AAGB00_09455 [Planctomycetota bacterium]
MSRFTFLSAVVALAVTSGSALAGDGHFDIFIGAAGGQTAYGGIDVDDGDVTPDLRVFEVEMPVDGTFPNSYSADAPGFNHPEDDGDLPPGVTSLSPGDNIVVNELSLTVDGVTADLFFWDGTGPVSFAPAPVGVDFSIVTEFMGNSIGTAGTGGGFDDHPDFFVGAVTLPTPGIYLGSLEAQAGLLDPTDPLFLVMGTDGLITPEFLGISQMDFDMLTDEQVDEELEEVIELAVEYVETSVIPEPGAAVLALVGGLGLMGRRRFNAVS